MLFKRPDITLDLNRIHHSITRRNPSVTGSIASITREGSHPAVVFTLARCLHITSPARPAKQIDAFLRCRCANACLESRPDPLIRLPHTSDIRAASRAKMLAHVSKRAAGDLILVILGEASDHRKKHPHRVDCFLFCWLPNNERAHSTCRSASGRLTRLCDFCTHAGPEIVVKIVGRHRACIISPASPGGWPPG